MFFLEIRWSQCRSFLAILCLPQLFYYQQPTSRKIERRKIAAWIPIKLLEQLDELSVIKGILHEMAVSIQDFERLWDLVYQVWHMRIYLEGFLDLF